MPAVYAPCSQGIPLPQRLAPCPVEQNDAPFLSRRTTTPRPMSFPADVFVYIFEDILSTALQYRYAGMTLYERHSIGALASCARVSKRIHALSVPLLWRELDSWRPLLSIIPRPVGPL